MQVRLKKLSLPQQWNRSTRKPGRPLGQGSKLPQHFQVKVQENNNDTTSLQLSWKIYTQKNMCPLFQPNLLKKYLKCTKEILSC